MIAKLRSICLRLPEAHEEAAWVLTFRASGFLYDTLRTAGPPFFVAGWGTRWGTKVTGMRLGKRTGWAEVATLLIESYCLLAPRKLSEKIRPCT